MDLFLDGCYDLHQTLKRYGCSEELSCSESVKVRALLPLHFALTVIRTLAVQTLRGTGNLVSGIIHLDGHLIAHGLNDYFALTVQSVVLPLLGIVTLISPTKGYQGLQSVCEKLDFFRTDDGDARMTPHQEDLDASFSEVRKGGSNAVMGVFGGISAFFIAVTFGLEKLIEGDREGAETTFRQYKVLIGDAPLKGISNCCQSEPEEAIFKANRLALTSL